MAHGKNKGTRQYFGTSPGFQKSRNRIKPKPKPKANSKKHTSKSHGTSRRASRW